MVKAQVWIYANRFDGFPKPGDLKLVEEELRPLNEGEYLAEAAFLSVDPYMRAYSGHFKIGNPIIGGQIAVIRESKNPNFPVGKYCFGQFGWRTLTIANGGKSKEVKNDLKILEYVLPDFKGLSPSLGLGMLGMPGNTAYFGFLEICEPVPNKTLVVSGAAGAVGSHVGQIGKIKGCKVIGIAGSDSKGKWLIDELKFDHFINYKTENVAESLKKLAPEGVDYYFDNVGGELSATIISQMNEYGRISACGAISMYNDKIPPKVSSIFAYLVMKQLRVEGFIVTQRKEWENQWMGGINQNLSWIQEGKLKYRETITDGFENMFQAFTDMLKGVNYGKAIVRVKSIAAKF